MSHDIAVNGRFQWLEPGGFRHFADQVATRLPAEVIVPPAFLGRGVRGRLWEKLVLPKRVGARVLINLTGTAVPGCRRQVSLVHDVLPLKLPDCYARSYVPYFHRKLDHLVATTDVIVVPSAEVRNDLIERFDLPGPSVIVVEPGLERPKDDPTGQAALDARLAAQGINASQPLVVGINSSVPRKNGASVLRALEKVNAQRPDVAVIAVGHDGPRRIFGPSPRPTSSDVPDLGSVDDRCMEQLLQRADAVVTLPLGEGFGLVPLEAAARGAHVVTSNIPSARHLNRGCAIVEGHLEAASALLDLLDEEPVSYDHLYDRLLWDRTANGVLRAALTSDGYSVVDLTEPASPHIPTTPDFNEGSSSQWHV
jgi:glycosyltransferase involved in cell wall biosynthesis